MRLIRRLLPALALLLAAGFVPAGAALAADPPAVTASDRVLGRADAPVTVIEYASFICPHCAHWHTDVLPLVKARWIDSGKVRLVYRDLPTPPQELSVTAAGIGLCAAPGRFFDVAAALMNGQAAVRAGGTLGDWYGPALTASGKTQAEIETCLADPATLEALQAQIDGAHDADVQGTPAFFVNGRAVANGGIETLAEAIEPLLGGG